MSSLPIPPLLNELIVAGRWPRTAADAVCDDLVNPCNPNEVCTTWGEC